MGYRKPHVRIERQSDQGRRLCEIRHRHGLTLCELARKLGMKDSYATALCRMETGRRKIPNALVMRLAQCYDVRPESLRGSQLEFNLVQGILEPSALPVGALEGASPEEKDELLRYLSYLRLKESKVSSVPT